jgi:hypothetical protein
MSLLFLQARDLIQVRATTFQRALASYSNYNGRQIEIEDYSSLKLVLQGRELYPFLHNI